LKWANSDEICNVVLNYWRCNLFNVFFSQACGGLTYTYAVYSGHLKNVLHYTQEQTDDVGAAKDFGSVLGLLSGLFYNYYPPWVTICIGASLHLFGYFMVWVPYSNDLLGFSVKIRLFINFETTS